MDDSAITSKVRSRMVEDQVVDPHAISVESSNGNVVLSGVAKSNVEKSTAESIAIKVPGVKSLLNNIVVKP
ncbi:MAG: BON domain-containing protein [Caldimonas sp.]